MLQNEFKDAKILTFEDANEAMQEITREAPDLFTTDWNHLALPCPEMFRQLIAQGAKYPIFVISACGERIATDGRLREFTDAGLNVTLIAKPFRWEDVRTHFAQYFSVSEAGTPIV